VPIGAAGLTSAKIVRTPASRSIPMHRTGSRARARTKSTSTFSRFWSA